MIQLLCRAAVLLAVLLSSARLVEAASLEAMPFPRSTHALLLAPLSRVATATGIVTVKGNRLLRDGHTWVPRGVVSVAFVAAPSARAGVYAQAHSAFDSDVLADIQAWGADTVRFQVSQPGLDPRSPLFTTGFVQGVTGAVQSARARGLNVIVSVQDEPQSGEADPADLPNDGTRRVWATLAPLFNADGGILYEMLNEPRLPASAANWSAWQAAMNRTIAAIRATGSRNVVVADGLAFAEQLSGAPALTDAAQETAYAVHPYVHASRGQTQGAWDNAFGLFSVALPVIVTEWTTVVDYYCDANTAAAAATFLQYLESHGIGLVAFGFDFVKDGSGSIVRQLDGMPSNFSGLRCSSVGFGPGLAVQQVFRSRTAN